MQKFIIIILVPVCSINYQVKLRSNRPESCNPGYVIGQVQICDDGVWKDAVCDNQWTLQDALVVCRELGHNAEGILVFRTIVTCITPAVCSYSTRCYACNHY